MLWTKNYRDYKFIPIFRNRIYESNKNSCGIKKITAIFTGNYFLRYLCLQEVWKKRHPDMCCTNVAHKPCRCFLKWSVWSTRHFFSNLVLEVAIHLNLTAGGEIWVWNLEHLSFCRVKLNVYLLLLELSAGWSGVTCENDISLKFRAKKGHLV